MKIVINTCYGGFSLSHTGMKAYYERRGIQLYAFSSTEPHQRLTDEEASGELLVFYCSSPMFTEESFVSSRVIKRDDPDLVAVIEELKEAANVIYSKLSVVEVPDNIEWEIEEHDGLERVAEKHKIW